MIKRLQISLSEEANSILEAIMKEANENNRHGHINYSDAISEMIVSAKIDIKALQLKHADLRKTLRSLASDDELDLDAIIKNLNELRGKATKSKAKPQSAQAELI